MSERLLTLGNRTALVHRMIRAEHVCAIAFLIGNAMASHAETPPTPRPRPAIVGDQSSAPKIESEPSPCRLRLGEIAQFRPEPPITGPGECTATEVVNLSAVLLPDKRRVLFAPAVTLQCSMAESVAHWIRDDIAPAIGMLGTALSGVETLDSFDCRTFNNIAGAHLSEHGHANAVDIRSLKLANGADIELTSASVSKTLREQLRQTACARFSTVLGNGADAHHENHVHIDLMQRSNNYKICQWNVLDTVETAALAAKKAATAATPIPASEVPLPRPNPHPHPLDNTPPLETVLHNPAGGMKDGKMRALAALSHAAPLMPAAPLSLAMAYAEEPGVTVGPWTIATTYKADKFDSCSMSRTTEGLDISFLRTQDGLLLFLQSQKWKLERGKTYAIRLVAGARSVESKAVAEAKAVTIALADRALNERLRTGDVLEVRGEGATLRVPLDGSTAALQRLDACFDKNSRAGVDTNPFVAPNHKP